MAFQTGTAVLSVLKGLDACCESTRIKFRGINRWLAKKLIKVLIKVTKSQRISSIWCQLDKTNKRNQPFMIE